MRSPNFLPNVETSEQERPPINTRVVEFAEGSKGIAFEGEVGSELEWGSNKWLDNPASRNANTAIILTESGNQYVVGRGVIVNARTKRAYVIPIHGHDTVPNVVFGEKWGVPGLFHTGQVRTAMAAYHGDGMANYGVRNQESPFTVANMALDNAVAEADEQELYNTRKPS